MSAILQKSEELLHAGSVPRLRRPDVVIIGDAHPVPELAKAVRYLIGKLLRSDAGRGRRALNLLPMLVCPRQKQGVVAKQAMSPGEHVRDQRRVGVPNVRARVHVVDGRGEVKLPGGCQASLRVSAMPV